MQKFSVSLVQKLDKVSHLRDKEKENVICPIYLRVYIDGKRTLKSTSHQVKIKDWDAENEIVKSSHRIAQHINADLTLKKENLQKDIIRELINGNQISLVKVRKSLGPEVEEIKGVNLFTFVTDTWIPSVRGKRSDGTLKNYTKHLKKIEEFVGSRKLLLTDITPEWITTYEMALREEVGNNYTCALIKTLRTFINAAKKHKLITEYPFDAYEFPKYRGPVKDYLTPQELKKWEEIIPELKGTYLYQAAIWLFFACYCGLRWSDWLQFGELNIDGDFMRLSATTKTKSPVSMPISNPLRRAIKLVLETPLTDREQKVNEKLKVIAKKLKINKKISTHTGRHTFAVSVCLGNKVTSETAAELMSITLETFVNNYSQVTDEKIKRETSAAWSNLV